MAGALPGAELGQVGDPQAIGRVDAEVAADQVGGEPMLLSSGRRAFALLGVDRDQPSLPHQPGDTLLADRHAAAELELLEDPWRTVGLLALLEDLPDLLGEQPVGERRDACVPSAPATGRTVRRVSR